MSSSWTPPQVDRPTVVAPGEEAGSWAWRALASTTERTVEELVEEDRRGERASLLAIGLLAGALGTTIATVVAMADPLVAVQWPLVAGAAVLVPASIAQVGRLRAVGRHVDQNFMRIGWADIVETLAGLAVLRGTEVAQDWLDVRPERDDDPFFGWCQAGAKAVRATEQQVAVSPRIVALSPDRWRTLEVRGESVHRGLVSAVRRVAPGPFRDRLDGVVKHADVVMSDVRDRIAAGRQTEAAADRSSGAAAARTTLASNLPTAPRL